MSWTPDASLGRHLPGGTSQSLTLALRIGVNNLQVQRDLIGTKHEIRFQDTICFISYPHQPPRLDSRSSSADIPVGIDWIEVEVDLKTAFSGREFCSTSNTDDPVAAQALTQFKAAADLGMGLAEKYLDRLRTYFGQAWVASSASRGRLVLPLEVCSPSGERRSAPFGYGPARLRSRSFQPVSIDQHKFLEGWIKSKSRSDFAELLLADAKNLRDQEAPDWRQVVLMSAITCEVKVKRTLLFVATEDQKPIVDLLLNHPRRYTMAAVTLFSSGLKAVCGKSLAEDRPDLYSAVERLFRDRNLVAHSGGKEVSATTFFKHVNTAEQAFHYLDFIERQKLYGSSPTI
jgi:hypothetical protein